MPRQDWVFQTHPYNYEEKRLKAESDISVTFLKLWLRQNTHFDSSEGRGKKILLLHSQFNTAFCFIDFHAIQYLSNSS